MDIQKITPARLAASVIAVPPLARNSHGIVCRDENTKLIRYLEAGGISTLLYGGNAVFYHIRLSEYESTLKMLVDTVHSQTLVVPSVGPSWGMMMDQADVLKEFDFPTAMILPTTEVCTKEGLARGIRKFAEAYGKPVVLYLKHNWWMDPKDVKKLVDDRLISWIKYAVVLPNPSHDDYLRGILDLVPADIVVSGMGEQPALCHMREFDMISFTSGCVCVAPQWSQRMLTAIQTERFDDADDIRAQFKTLEDLRDAINPIRVLHSAVESAGICKTGPITPMLSGLSEPQIAEVSTAAHTLLDWERKAKAS